MAQINKPSDYFDIKLWTGNGSTQTISGLSFQPDLVWGKSRSTNYEQSWIDSVRGGTKYLFSNGSSAESTDVNAITAFNSDGYDLGSSPYIGNANTITYVGWNWLGANGTSANTDGSIASTVSANTTSGFSVVSYTGTGGVPVTVGHGLGVIPEVLIIKNRTSTFDWAVYHKDLGNTGGLFLNTTSAFTTDGDLFNNTSPTSSVVTFSNSTKTNQGSANHIMYAFNSVKGYSKFGSYTGNSSTDGTFIYTGFKPAFLLIKNTSAVQSWWMWDNKRIGYNGGGNHRFRPNGNDSEFTDATSKVDLLSNGFKWRDGDNAYNYSGNTFIYMAFAENPLVGTNNIPATAR